MRSILRVEDVAHSGRLSEVFRPSVNMILEVKCYEGTRGSHRE